MSTPPTFGQGQFGQIIFGPPGEAGPPPEPPVLGTGILTSLLIDGTEFKSSAVLSISRIIWDISSRIATANFTLDTAPGATEIHIGAEVKAYLDDELAFGGYIDQIQPVALSLISPYRTAYQISVRDYSSILDSVVVSTDFVGVTDKAIITTLMTVFVPSLVLTGVDVVVADQPDFLCDGVTLRNVLENLISQTGAEFWVDCNKVLHYHAFGAVVAPFSISFTPNYSTSFPALGGALNVLVDGSNLVNRVTVLGKGAVSVTLDDTTSQAMFGVKAKNVVDRSLRGVPEAQARAQIELNRFSFPQVSGSFTVLQGGLRMGQAISIYWPVLGINSTYMVRRVELTWAAKAGPRYAVEFGDYRPDLVKTLRTLATTTQATSSTNPGTDPVVASTDGIIAYA